MTLKALEHVQLAMPSGQEDRARVFYGEVLGLTEIPKPANLAIRGGLWFQNGSVKVHLGIDAEFRPATKAHPAFVVDDVKGLLERCSARGYKIADGEPLEGWKHSYVYDPFGNRIEVMEPD